MKRSELLTALEIVRPGLANREVIEQSTSFAFMKNRVVTYNDEISISHPIEGLDVEGAIQADELYKILQRISKEDIDITVSENEILITAGKAKAGLTLFQEIKLPLQEIGEMEDWHLLPTNFIRGLKFVIPSCGRESSKPNLMNIHCNDQGFLEASDGHRISRLVLNKELGIPTFLLPSDTARKVFGLAPNKIANGKGWVHFKTDLGTIISCRKNEDKFPDTTALIQVQGIELTLPDGIEDVLDRASVFAKRDSLLEEQILFKAEKQKLTIRSESDTGWFEEKLKVEFQEYVNFSITPALFKDIIKETKTFTLNPKLIKFEGEDWIYIMAVKY